MSDGGTAVAGTFCISGAAQLGRNLGSIQLLAYRNHGRTCINLGRIAEDSASHSAIDYALILEIEEGKHGHKSHACANEGDDEYLD